MFRKIFSSSKFWGVIGTVGSVATVVGTVFTLIAEPKNAEEEYRKIAKEEVKNALADSNKGS